MHRQGIFSQAEYASKKKQTRRAKFLAEMEQVVPWPWSGGAGTAALSEGRARPAAGEVGSDAAASLFAAMVRAGRPGDGGSAVRQLGDAGLCRD